jgi:hypothetical protein
MRVDTRLILMSATISSPDYYLTSLADSKNTLLCSVLALAVPPDGHWILGDESGHLADLDEVQQLQVQIIM